MPLSSWSVRSVMTTSGRTLADMQRLADGGGGDDLHAGALERLGVQDLSRAVILDEEHAGCGLFDVMSTTLRREFDQEPVGSEISRT